MELKITKSEEISKLTNNIEKHLLEKESWMKKRKSKQYLVPLQDVKYLNESVVTKEIIKNGSILPPLKNTYLTIF